MKINTNYRTPALAGLSLIAATLTSHAATISVLNHSFQAVDLEPLGGDTNTWVKFEPAAAGWMLAGGEPTWNGLGSQPRIVNLSTGNSNINSITGVDDDQFVAQVLNDGAFTMTQALTATLTADTSYTLTAAFTSIFDSPTSTTGDEVSGQARLYADYGGANQTLVADTGLIGWDDLNNHHKVLTDYSGSTVTPFTAGHLALGSTLTIVLDGKTNRTGATNNTAIGMDNIRLTSVPEPSSTALLGLGGLALILRRLK